MRHSVDMDRIGARAKPEYKWRELLGGGFDWMRPGQSMLSHALLPAEAVISPTEFSQLTFLQPPWCACCAFPFEQEHGEDILCAACLARKPLYGRARAPLAYSDAASQLILSFKRQGRRAGLKLFAKLMYEAGQELVDEADLIIPVPLHARRLVQRGFNQAGWLASALSQVSGAPVSHDVLMRRRASQSQGHLSPLQRRANVAAAFELRARHAHRLRGRRLLLVDDVLTTGATVESCIRALKKAQPANVDIITLARVVAPRKQAI